MIDLRLLRQDPDGARARLARRRDPAVDAMLDAPRGIFAFNGGDGSGKTTSLLALAQELLTRGKLIVDSVG